MTKQEKTAKATVEDASDEEGGVGVKGQASKSQAGDSQSNTSEVKAESSATNSEDSKEDSSETTGDNDKEEEEGGSKSGEGANTVGTSSNPWQAIFSPQYNAYYFYNAETQETTWQNPLAGAEEGSSSTAPTEEDKTDQPSSNAGGFTSQLHEAALAAGIDPALAHLDPTLMASIGGTAGASGSGLPPSFTAKFNARTGQFTRPDGRDPTHLSEHARAQRMSEFYFDVNGWQEQLAEQGGSIQGPEESRKRKRPSKKDLERFKEQKKQKKIAKTAWLRT